MQLQLQGETPPHISVSCGFSYDPQLSLHFLRRISSSLKMTPNDDHCKRSLEGRRDQERVQWPFIRLQWQALHTWPVGSEIPALEGDRGLVGRRAAMLKTAARATCRDQTTSVLQGEPAEPGKVTPLGEESLSQAADHPPAPGPLPWRRKALWDGIEVYAYAHTHVTTLRAAVK